MDIKLKQMGNIRRFITNKEKLHDLYCSPSRFIKSKRMRRACSTNGQKRTAYRVLVGKPGGKTAR
jgi:hypothetical protein